MLPDIEAAWLNYAWRVVNCPESHRARCIREGVGVPGPGRVDGNDLRLPGYLGRNYEPEREHCSLEILGRIMNVINAMPG